MNEDVVPVSTGIDGAAITQSVFMMVTNVIGIIIWSKWGKSTYTGIASRFTK